MSSITKRALAASFKNLLGSRTLDKITVKDIVEDARVNRQTFYYHFCDIYDLIRWILDGEAQVALAAADTIVSWKAYLTGVLKSLMEERALVMNALNSLSREYLEQYLYDAMYRLVYSTLNQICKGLSVSDEDKRFIADFYKHAFVGVLLDWARKGMRDDPEVLVDRLIHMLDGELRHYLKKFSN